MKACLFVLLLAVPALATNYYVDQGHVSASDSNSGIDEEAPWLTLKHATLNAAAGDTVFVKAGTYTDEAGDYRGFWPSNSGTSGHPIVFKSMPNLAAIIEAKNWDGVNAGNGYLAWGTYNNSYIVIDGFRIYGGHRFQGGSHNTIKNCELTGGYHPSDDNSLHWGISTHGSTDCLIQNNYVHSPLSTGNRTHNTAGIMLYQGSHRAVVEYNSVDGGDEQWYSAYGTKGGAYDDCTWRYNFGANVRAGFLGMGSTAGHYSHYRAVIHNNVVVNASYAFIDMDRLSIDFDIYNNTMYNSSRFINSWKETNAGLELWNNIAASTSDFFIIHGEGTPIVPTDFFDYSDYNVSDVSSVWFYLVNGSGNLSYTLVDFRTNTAFGDNSINGSVNFVNPGGTSPEDYKRTSYPTNGRGGDYASVMGAYVTGNETIGYTSDGESPAALAISTATRSGGNATISWSDVTADSYQVQVDASGVTIYHTTTTDTSVTIPDVDTGSLDVTVWPITSGAQGTPARTQISAQ